MFCTEKKTIVSLYVIVKPKFNKMLYFNQYLNETMYMSTENYIYY